MNLNNMCKEKKRVEGSIGESPVRMYSHKEQRTEINLTMNIKITTATSTGRNRCE